VRTEPRTPRLPALLVLVLASLMLLSACGVPLDAEPVSLNVPDDVLAVPESTTTTTVPPSADVARRTIYLVKGGKLFEVTREIPQPVFNQKIFDTLVQGPTQEELDEGIETRIPSDIEMRVLLDGQGILTIDLLNDAFFQIEGDLRITATAQFVFTALRVPATRGVLFQQAGEYVQLARGDNLLQPLDENGVPEPFTRADFPDLDPLNAGDN